MKNAMAAVVFIVSMGATAQNPVIRDQYCADPTARVFNGRVYMYPSHDIVPPEAYPRKDWFCMEDYHVFSSDNLTDWTDHGVIVTQEQVPWGNPTAYAMWAPDCVYATTADAPQGKYFFYFPDAPREGRGFAIGVATADRPEGPFTCEPEPIRGVYGIDPCVLCLPPAPSEGRESHEAYIYWSGMGGIRGAKLKANMKEIEPTPREGTSDTLSLQGNKPPFPLGGVGGRPMEGLPEGFKEGPFVFKRQGWCYLTFPWVRGETGEGKNPTETLAYAMSKSPLGPWDFKGIFMAEHENGCWTNHHSFVEYRGQWYLFYHTNFFSPRDDKRRSVCVEKVTFNADGTIQEVKQTLRGVGINRATERIDIDRYSAVGTTLPARASSVGGASPVRASSVGGGSPVRASSVGGGSPAPSPSIASVDTVHPFRGCYIDLPAKSWLCYDNVDFSPLTPSDAYLVVSAKAADNTVFTIREKSPKGKVIARIPMTVKSEVTRPGFPAFHRDQSGQWLTQTATLAYTPKGTTDLVVTCEGDAAVSIDWMQFKNRPLYFTPVSEGAIPSHPDGQGFIRRWRLMEPLAVDVRSNTVFTNSWLRQKFADELARLPKQKKARWYALDSETYNMKLFRFAEKYGRQTYGSFFWCETVIDCAEDIPGVRLAAGSNGASMWWLNGDEVLLLEGDRRMVEDDGMSARLTLKKGRNVLRCAVINGPGLSDMCARFVDEKGNAVTNYELRVKN